MTKWEEIQTKPKNMNKLIRKSFLKKQSDQKCLELKNDET